MEVPRDQMENEILQFVQQHPESTASLAVSRRIIGELPGERSEAMLVEIQRRIGDVPKELLETCYYIVK